MRIVCVRVCFRNDFVHYLYILVGRLVLVFNLVNHYLFCFALCGAGPWKASLSRRHSDERFAFGIPRFAQGHRA